jgi:biotin operon repressor
MHRGFITLHRKIVDWEWYSDINVFRLFTHLILTANWKPKRWQGEIVNRGQKVISIQNLAQETGLTEQSVRTAIKKLKSTGELTSKSTNKYTVVTLTNYELYQSEEKQATSKITSELTNEEQTTNKQLTTTKQCNNITIKTNKEKSPADFEKSAKENLPILEKSEIEPSHVEELQPKQSNAEKSLKEKKPNAWGIWVDVNREFGRTDPFPIGKDTKAAKSILTEIKDPEKYADILRQFLSDDDKFLMQNGHSISFLSSKINKYLNKQYQAKAVDDTYYFSPEEEAEIWAMEDRIAKEEAEKAKQQKE